MKVLRGILYSCLFLTITALITTAALSLWIASLH